MSCDYYADPRPDVQALLDVSGRRVLDVGCGAGALASALKGQGAAHVSGIETNPDAAARAREHVDLLVEADVTSASFPFDEGEFDYLIYADVLEHLPDPGSVLASHLRYLAPEGRVVVSVPNFRFYSVLARLLIDRWSYTESGIRDRTHLRIFTRRSLSELLSSVGLTPETMARNYRLFEDQSSMGRWGALATRMVRRTVAPWLFRDLMTFQYLVVARRAGGG